MPRASLWSRSLTCDGYVSWSPLPSVPISPSAFAESLSLDAKVDATNGPQQRSEGEFLNLCVSDRAHAVFRYGQASKRPANIMALMSPILSVTGSDRLSRLVERATHRQTSSPSARAER